MNKVKAWIKRKYWQFIFNRLSITDKKIMKYLDIDPDSLIRKGKL